VELPPIALKLTHGTWVGGVGREGGRVLFGVPGDQVVVDGDDVHSLALQGVQVGRQGGHQRLALPRAHLCNLALMEDHPTNLQQSQAL